MPQVRERNSILNLSRQIFGSGSGNENPKTLALAFEAVCSHPEKFNYLIVDLRSQTPQQFMLRESFDIREPIVSYQTLH
jgi:hypothetical protein